MCINVQHLFICYNFYVLYEGLHTRLFLSVFALCRDFMYTRGICVSDVTNGTLLIQDLCFCNLYRHHIYVCLSTGL